MSFRADPPPWAGIGANGAISGVATTPGTYTFTLRNNGAPQTFTMRITALAQKEWNVPDASVGVSYSYQLGALNASGPATFAVTGTDAVNMPPPGMTLSASGLLSGTPTASGFYNIWYSISDGVDTIYKGVSISVYDVHFVTDLLLPTATINVPYTATLSAAGGTAPYSYSWNVNCCGLTLSPDGVISGTPTFGSSRLSVDITVSDAHGISRVQRFDLASRGLPQGLPNVGTYGTFLEGCSYGTPCNRGIYVGSGVPPYSWNVTGLPTGMSFRTSSTEPTMSWITPGDLELWGAPTQVGTFTITATVTDGDGQVASNTFDFTVSPLWLWNYVNSGTIGQPFSQTLRELGGRPPYTATIVDGRLPNGLTLDSNALTISGTPQENGSFFVAIDFTDQDGATERTEHFPYFGSATSTITLNTGDDLGSVQEGFFYSNPLQACCVPSYHWVLAGGTLPAGMTLSSTGLLSGTPAAGTSGEYHPVIRVEDAANSANFAVHQFTLVVTTLGVTSHLPNGNVGTPYSGSLTATGGSGTVTWSLGQFQHLPPGLTLHTNGTIDGTPTARGFFGFQVIATDTGGHVRTIFFGINIYGPGELPPLNLPFPSTFGSLTIGQQTLQFNATGGSAPYHYSLSPGGAEVPGVRVQDGQPLPTFFQTTATGGLLGVVTTPGSYPTSIRVTDGAAQVFDRPTALIVSPLQILWPTPTNATLGVPYSFTLTPYGGTSYTWSAVNLPAGLSIDATGQISGTPMATGSFYSTVTLTDLPTGNTINLGVSVTVDPFAIVTGGSLPPATVGTLYSQTLAAPGCTGTCTWNSFGTISGGLTLSSDGVLSGTPTSSGVRTLYLQVTGSNGTVLKAFTLAVAPTTAQPLTPNTITFNDFTVGGQSATPLFAQGGTPPYTWSVVDGSLPPGMSLQGPGDILGSFLAPGVPYIIGRPMQVGTYNFTLQVRDAIGTTVTLPPTSWYISPIANSYFTLPGVNQQPLMLNTPYTQPLLFMGGTNSYTFANLDPMPPGLALNATTGVVSGTPSNTGTFTVRIKATDTASNSFTAFITFNVAGPTSTVLNFPSGSNLGSFPLGSSPSFSMTPTNGTAPYTITAVGPLPAGFVLLPTTGPAGAMQVAGIAATPGTYSFTIQAVDAVGNEGVRTFSFVVAPFALLGSTTLGDGSVGTPYSYTFTLSNGAGVTWSAVPGFPLPPGLNISSGGVLSGTPTTAGVFTIRLNATDAGSGAVITFFLSLKVSNISVTGPSILPGAVVGQPYSYTFPSSGGGTKSWSVSGLPSNLTFDQSTGEISGTPQSAGAFSLFVSVTDGSVPNITRRFLLPVVTAIPGVLDIALTNTLLTDMTLGQATIVTLAASGGTPPYTFSAPTGLPPGLSLVAGAALSPGSFFPGTTLLTGVPTVAGPISFDLVVTDSAGASTRRTFTGNVRTIGILGTLPLGTVGTALSVQLTAVGGTAPYTFTAAPTAQFLDMFPAGVSLTPEGLLSGTPTSTGNFRALVTATDHTGLTMTRLIAFSVFNSTSQSWVTTTNPVDTPLGRRVALTLAVSSLSPPPGPPPTYTWSVVSGSLPPGEKLETDPDIVDVGSTMLAGQPTAAGTYTFTLRATNAANAADVVDRVFTQTVTPTQIVFPPSNAFFTGPLGGASYISLPTGHVGQPYSGTLKVAGGTPPYTFAVNNVWPFGAMPAGLVLNSTGEIVGTPQAIGNYLIPLVVSDSGGHSMFQAARVTVTLPGAPAPLIASSSSGAFPGTVGSPYVFPLDLFLAGGDAPYTWSLHGGSTLPPGLALLGGGNGVPMALAGIPAMAGDFGFSLDVVDAHGQMLTVSTDVFITTIGVSVNTLPPGFAGTPYPPVALGPIGGVPPYTVDALSDFDMPAGLTLSSAGLLSGTPLTGGTFTTVVRVKDAIGNEFFKAYLITVDDAAGEVPTVRIGPNPIQIHYDLGDPAPPPVPLGITTTSGVQSYALSLSGAVSATLSANSGATPGTPNLLLDVSGLGAGTYVGLLGLISPDSINKTDAAPVIFTVTPPPPCTFGIDPVSGTVAATGGAGSFALSTGSQCSWTATASDSWITVTSGASGTGSHTVSFTAGSNGGVSPRTGTITVNGATYTLTQFGSACSFAITPTGIFPTAAGGTASIAVTASGSSCVWPTTTGLGATPTTGTGNGTVSVTIPANPDPATRLLTATIAGQTFNVTQGGAACTTSLDSLSASLSSAGGGGTVGVTTPSGCGYSTVLGPGWIHVTSGASGSASGTLLYSVDANSTTVGRSGSIVIGGQAFQITQEPLACSATLDTSGLGSPYGVAGGSGAIGITTNGPNCSWTASSDNGWLSVSPPSGTGNATLVVGVGSNAGSLTGRTAALTVAGQTVGVSQGGTVCNYSLQSSIGTAPAGGGAGSVGVIAPAACTWAAVSNDPSWLSISSSGTAGSSDVNFVAQANTAATPRSGTLTVAGLIYTVNQGPAPCAYTLTSGGITVGASGGSDSFGFSTTTSGCSPAVQSFASWLHASSPPLVGTSGTVSWTADANPSGANRVGVIQVGTQTFVVTQLGAACAFSLNAYGAYFSAAGLTGNYFLGSPSGLGCTPTVSVDLPSIVMLGALSGPVSDVFTQGYDVLPFVNVGPAVYRRAKITFGGQIFIVKQSSW